jgi:hypothetical protein
MFLRPPQALDVLDERAAHLLGASVRWGAAVFVSGASSPCWVTRHFPCLARPLQLAAGSNQAAGKLPVATAASLLDTVVVTRRRRRMASFAFPSGGASADSPDTPRHVVQPG